MGLGNIFSVFRAINRFGSVEVIRVDCLEKLPNVEALVLPGVSSTKKYMERIRQRKWQGPLKLFVRSKKPILGICSGFQVLSDWSDEDGGCQGLGVIPGNTVKLSREFSNTGWLECKNFATKGSKKMLGLESMFTESRAYFNHSYGVRSDHTFDFESKFSGPYFALLIANNIWGAQFHPECSQKFGHEFFRSFLFGKIF